MMGSVNECKGEEEEGILLPYMAGRLERKLKV